MKRVFLTLFFLLASAIFAQAATYCVATNGSDSADGLDDGSPACWLTLQKAANTAVAGDTVNVRAGTYRERVTIANSGTASQPIVFNGEPGAIANGGTIVTGWTLACANGGYVKTIASVGFTPGNLVWDDKQSVWAADAIMNARGTNDICRDNTSFWDGRDMLGGNFNANAYIRFRDGRNPSSSTIELAPRDVGVFNLTGKSYVHIKGFTIKNGHNSVRISGGGNNLIENNTIQAGAYMVVLTDATNANIIQGNLITQNYTWADYGHFRDRSALDNNALDHNRLIGDIFGVGVHLLNAGIGNQILQNQITRVLAGIFPQLTIANDPNINRDVVIGDNTFTNCADYCVLVHQTPFANGQIRDNLFHEYHTAHRWGPVYHGPVYVYRNRYSMESYPAGVGTGGGASTNYISLFNVNFPSTGVFFYHNSYSGAGSAYYHNDCMTNLYVINNVFSSKTFITGPATCNYAYFDYNWIGGGSTFVPASAAGGNTHNKIQAGQFLWPLSVVPRSWTLTESSTARNMGLDISQTWSAGSLGNKSALPGFQPGYFTGAQPDAGAIQFAGAPPPSEPLRSNGSPSGTLASGTTQTTLSLSTTAAATCKYGTVSGTAYASIANTFTTTGNLTHSSTISVSDGNSYTFYVRCQDSGGAVNTSDFTIAFSVASPPVGPVRTNGAPSGTLAAGTTETTLSLSTDANATCKYGTISGTAYASIANTFTTTGGTSHSQGLTSLTAGNYAFYVRCSGAEVNTDDFVIAFSIAAPATQAAHWLFDENGGTTALDASGAGRHATVFGGPSVSLGGGGLNLGGAENDYSTAPVGSIWSGDFTVIIDAEATSTGQTAGKSVFANYGNWFQTDTSDSFQIDVDGAAPGVYRWNVVSGTTCTIATVTVDRQIIAVRKSGTTITPFNNGVAGTPCTVGASTGNTFRDYVFGVNRAGTLYWVGKIWEAWVYQGALSDAEIAAFSGATPPAAPSSLACARSTTTDAIDCTWTDNSSDEENFIVHQNVGGAGYAQVAVLPINASSYSSPIATSGVSQCLKVLAQNTGGASSFATESCVTAPPLTAHQAGATGVDQAVNLAWVNQGVDIGGILILRRAGAAVGSDRPTDTNTYNVNDTIGSSTVIFNGVPSTPDFADTGRTNGTTYHYKIFTRSVSGNRYSAGVALSATPVAPSVTNRVLRDLAAPSAGRSVAVGRGARQ